MKKCFYPALILVFSAMALTSGCKKYEEIETIELEDLEIEELYDLETLPDEPEILEYIPEIDYNNSPDI